MVIFGGTVVDGAKVVGSIGAFVVSGSVVNAVVDVGSVVGRSKSKRSCQLL